MFEGIEGVTLDLKGEDKVVVTILDYLRSLLQLLSITPSKTLGKYRPVILFGKLDSAHHISTLDSKFKILKNA
jgi:hypothetical protein